MTEPPAFLADPSVAAILGALPSARVVGGAVRDALAGSPVADIDLATPSPPADVAAALSRAGIRTVPTGLDHGTLTAVVGGRGFEITTLRRDIATDGRHAVVAFTADWREDAARRDFTINAMSMSRDGTVFDYFGGKCDLRHGAVRFVGDPATRIAEDYLRILRFFRFYARYGAGLPDPAAVSAIGASVPGLAGLSAERVWNELTRILTVPDPMKAMTLMAELGVLQAIVPEGTDLARLGRLVGSGAPIDGILRLAALLTGDALSFAMRLKLSTADRDRLVALRQPSPLVPGDDDLALRRALADTDKALLIDRTWRAGDDEAWRGLRKRLAAVERPVFPLEGRHVVALGVSAGPAVGDLLRAIRNWWLERGCVDQRDACLAELRHRIAT
jgi:poly(A) polymerase